VLYKDLVVEAEEQRDASANLFERKNSGVQAVVKIGSQIGDLIREVDQLRFERGKLVEQILGQFRMLDRRVIPRMLDDAFAGCQGQIQSAERGVTLFKPSDDAQRVQIVVESESESAQRLVECLLSGVAEGRMADVMDQGESFGQFRVQAKRSG